MSDHHEIERTFAPDPRATMPDLSAVDGVAQVGPPVVAELDAAYVDTLDLALVRAGITLRRRTGGHDEGWHLKVPAGTGRDEVHAHVGSDATRPPLRLRRLVLGRTRGAPLQVVATISTRRTTTELLAEDGSVLAEVADDEVTGSLPDGPTVTWREWEVELVDGPEELLEEVAALMTEEGVGPAEVQRKVEHVLGDRLPGPRVLAEVGRKEPAGALLQHYLAEQVEALLRHDVSVRRGRAEGVHQVRVACRRLRSALAAYRPLLDRGATEPLRDELQWLGHALSDTRDAVVARDLLLEALDAEERRLVVGPVRRRVRSTYERAAREGLREAERVLGSERYLRLLDALDRLVADPPLTDEAVRRAKDVLPARVRKQAKRVNRELDAVRRAADDHERELAWHEARKAAKRLRYAAEVLRPAFGKEARRTVAQVKELTKVLGERQDTVVVREHLLRLAADARSAGEPDFTYGLLLARQEALESELAYRAWETLDMLKSGTRIAGVAVRLK